MPLLYLESQGCQMNERDAERTAAGLIARGWELVDDPARADLILLCACSVRAKAQEHALGRLGQLSGLRRKNPELLFGLTGCLGKHLGDRVRKRLPGLNLVAGPGAVERLPELVEGLTAGDFVSDLAPARSFRAYAAQRDRRLPHPAVGPRAAFVTITEGCDNFCAYCIVPYLRGRLRCRAPEEILREVRSLIARGYCELTLLGQNVNAYRHGEWDFVRLLQETARSANLRRLRFISSHPRDFSSGIFEVIAEQPAVCEHVHLPLQSGSDAVLERMGRGYSTDRYRELVTEARERVPGLALTTDVIVGFPGETAADHRRTIELLEWAGFDNAFTFKYSPRAGTRAAELTDEVPPAVKQSRLEEVMAAIETSARANNAALLGAELEVAVEGQDKRGRPFGRTRTNKLVKLPREARAPLGCYLRARIVDSSPLSLEGEPL
jgi:tRNA-2-methylthio-N6-dimethylallyladenosine synthase